MLPQLESVGVRPLRPEKGPRLLTSLLRCANTDLTAPDETGTMMRGTAAASGWTSGSPRVPPRTSLSRPDGGPPHRRHRGPGRACRFHASPDPGHGQARPSPPVPPARLAHPVRHCHPWLPGAEDSLATRRNPDYGFARKATRDNMVTAVRAIPDPLGLRETRLSRPAAPAAA
jgi:hypothetical protein